jgi:hypothetical protein
VDGLRFTGAAKIAPTVPPNAADQFVEAVVTVRNVSRRPLERTYDGGCFIRRFQAYLDDGAERRLAWDSARSANWACTDDLAILNLRPGEETSPANWRAGIRLSEIRDSLPAGRYEIVIQIQAGEQTIRAGFVDLD